MTGSMKQDLFVLVEKHPFRCRRLVKKGTNVSLRAKGEGYDAKIVGGELDGYTFQLTEKDYYHYIHRTS